MRVLMLKLFTILVVLITYIMLPKENINVPEASESLPCGVGYKPLAGGTLYFTKMKEIKLTKGMFAQVDDWNYDWLNQWNWYASKGWKTYYAKRDVKKDGIKTRIFMHRQIMNAPKGVEVDHKDHNGLNCQEFNMRNCTHAQNQMNKTAYGVSSYLGVYYNQGHIRAVIRINGKQKHLGYFKTEEKAARAYDKEAKLHHGKFANLNFKE